ncbi:hypothetical protein ACJX0J_040462, partial [Zea mays]
MMWHDINKRSENFGIHKSWYVRTQTALNNKIMAEITKKKKKSETQKFHHGIWSLSTGLFIGVVFALSVANATVESICVTILGHEEIVFNFGRLFSFVRELLLYNYNLLPSLFGNHSQQHTLIPTIFLLSTSSIITPIF